MQGKRFRAVRSSGSENDVPSKCTVSDRYQELPPDAAIQEKWADAFSGYFEKLVEITNFPSFKNAADLCLLSRSLWSCYFSQFMVSEQFCSSIVKNEAMAALTWGDQALRKVAATLGTEHKAAQQKLVLQYQESVFSRHQMIELLHAEGVEKVQEVMSNLKEIG